MKYGILILRIAAVLWLIWGLVHIFAGVMTMGQVAQGSIAGAVHGITDLVERSTLEIEYPYAVGAIISQHGWNLLWAGIATTVGSFFVWRKNGLAIIVNAAVGGLFDMDYFLFIDLAGLSGPPGPQMTYICATAIVLSLYVYFKSDRLKNLA